MLVRILAGSAAVTVGLLAQTALIWHVASNSEAPDAEFEAFLYTLFFLPLLGVALAGGLATLDRFAPADPAQRMLLLLSGGIAIPLALALLAALARIGVDGLSMLAIGPSVLACALYAVATAFVPARLLQRGSDASPS